MTEPDMWIDPETANVVYEDPKKPKPEVKVTDNRHATIAERAAAAREAAREARERVAKHRPGPPVKEPEKPEQPAEPSLYFNVKVFMKDETVLEPKDPLPDTEAGIFRELMKLEKENPDARTFQLTLADGTIYFGRSQNIEHVELRLLETDVQKDVTQVE